jgi:hypothetical protein
MDLFFSLGQNALFAATVPILAWRLRENLTPLNDVSAPVPAIGTTYDVTSGDECISFTGDTVGRPTTDG